MQVSDSLGRLVGFHGFLGKRKHHQAERDTVPVLAYLRILPKRPEVRSKCCP